MSEGLRKWSQVSDEEADQYKTDPARRVVAPGTALIVTGCLGIVANILLGFGLAGVNQDRGEVARPAGMDDATFQSYQWGRQAAPLFDCFLIAVPALVVYPLVIMGGVRMRQLLGRGLAITAAVLAMAPCSPVILLGLPVGVWSLMVMADPAVRAAFGQGRRR